MGSLSRVFLAIISIVFTFALSFTLPIFIHLSPANSHIITFSPPQVTSPVTCMGNQLVGVEWNCKWHNVQLGQKLLPVGEANGIFDLDSIHLRSTKTCTAMSL